MPSKIQLDENLWFLFICLQKSDYKTIDFNAVGEATNLKPPAARMRFTRLRRQIEDGTLIGTHGTPFAGGAEKIAAATKKRKQSIQSQDPMATGNEPEELEHAIKSRGVRVNSCVLPVGDVLSSEPASDSEDETPLAKLRSGIIERLHDDEDVSDSPLNAGRNVSPHKLSPSASTSEIDVVSHDRPSDEVWDTTWRSSDVFPGISVMMIPPLGASQVCQTFPEQSVDVSTSFGSMNTKFEADENMSLFKLEEFPEILEEETLTFFKSEGETHV